MAGRNQETGKYVELDKFKLKQYWFFKNAVM
jgi:hypothetical protein